MSDAHFASPPVFNPARWFWLAGDGRVYSSAAGKVITVKQKPEWAAYQAFCRIASPTPWPRDDVGNQSETALNAVLEANGLPALSNE